MLLVRNVFHAKYGMGDQLVELIREGESMWTSSVQHARILTDASGKFFTVVLEFMVEDFAAYQTGEREEFSHPEFGEWFARMVPLVDNGYREFFHVVSMQA